MHCGLHIIFLCAFPNVLLLLFPPLPQTIAGVISSLLESLTSEVDMSHADSAAQRHQKRAVLSQALLELQSFPNLLQCYNAAYYFVTNSTAPRPVTAVGTAVCSDNNSIMSTADPHQQNATVEMAITPAGKEFLFVLRSFFAVLELVGVTFVYVFFYSI